jgi:hypothetical protein
MSLNHIVEGGLADITLDVKGITIQGEPVGLKPLSLTEAAYPALDLSGVGNVYLASGPSTTISGVGGLTLLELQLEVILFCLGLVLVLKQCGLMLSDTLPLFKLLKKIISIFHKFLLYFV